MEPPELTERIQKTDLNLSAIYKLVGRGRMQQCSLQLG